MEVKIITSEREVNIFEGENIHYKIVSYKNNSDFIDKSQKLLETGTTNFILGCPDSLYDTEQVEQGLGSFIFLSWVHINEFYSIIVKNSVIYITNNGKTIDSTTIS